MTDDGALSRIRTFWRRVLWGPSVGARIEIYEELAPTLTAGIGLREALHSVAERHSGAKRRAVELLADALARDVSLSETMRANPECFTVLEAALVATGERTGRYDTAFRAAAAQLDRSRRVRTKVIAAVSYPALVVHCFILMCSLVGMFQGGSFLRVAVPSFALLWGGLFAVASLHAALADSVAYVGLLQRVPSVGAFVRAGSLARFARAFAALHGGGSSYEESLRFAAEASGNAVIRADVAKAVVALAGGAPFPSALAVMDSIPSDDRGLLIAGEQSGDLESAANRVATLEDDRYERRLMPTLTLLFGALVVLVGIAVGAYAISFYAGQYAELNKMLK